MRTMSLYARYLCSRDALGIKAGRPSAARDDRVSCIQTMSLHVELFLRYQSNLKCYNAKTFSLLVMKFYMLHYYNSH